MKKITNLRTLIGIIKDKASQSKAAFVFNPKTFALHLSLLRTTTHDSFTPPNQRHLTAFLSFGQGSRATAAACIEALMDRLQTTRDASVALKCLITVHHIIKEGSFILQDQLSVYPSYGGRNYLNLSNFRDDTTPLTWELSSWLRWYALYLEHILSTSRVLGFFLISNSVKDCKEDGNASALMTTDLRRELESLVSLLEEVCRKPDSVHVHGNNLLEEIMRLVAEDYLTTMNEVSIRVNELKERLGCLSFADSVELGCALKRLEDCRESLTGLTFKKRGLIESFWDLVIEVRSKVSDRKMVAEEERKPAMITWGRRGKSSESARFEGRFLGYNDSVRFASGRLVNIDYRFPLAMV